MQFFSDQQKQLVMDTLRKNRGDVAKTASQIGITPNQVNWVNTIMTKKSKYIEGKGNPALHPYIVAIRDNNVEPMWNNEANPKIMKARELYDEGLIELVTGRDKDNFILYAIPRRTPEPDRYPYFPENEQRFLEEQAKLIAKESFDNARI